MLRTLGCALWCALTLLPRARAEQPQGPLRLDWVRAPWAESCVSGAELTRELSQAGFWVENSQREGPAIEGFVERDLNGAQWRARMRVLDAQGEERGSRTVQSAEADCAALKPAILLVLGLMFEASTRQAEAAPPAPSTADNRAPSPKPASSTAASADDSASVLAASPNDAAIGPEPSSEDGWRADISAGVGLAFGLNPSATYGPSLGLHLATPWWVSFAASAHYWTPNEVALAQPRAAGDGASFQAMQANFSLCLPFVEPARVAVLGCWGGFVGARFIRTSGLEGAMKHRRAFGGPLVTLRLSVALNAHFRVLLDLTGVAMGREDTFLYGDTQGEARVLFRPSLFAFLPTLAVAARF